MWRVKLGIDALEFNGASIGEKFDISANGGRAQLTRDIGTITMDLNDVETINLHASGGADTITVSDLTGTDVTNVNIDLGVPGGGGDGAVDTVIINATNGDDAITITTNNGVVTVSGLGTDITISNFEANDKIVINGLDGDDIIEASGLTGMQLIASGGNGDDVLIGSAGDDILNGDAGDDVLIGGPGQDILDGGTGGNVVIQSAVGGNIALLSQFMASSFVEAGNGPSTMPIAEQPVNEQPLLAQPHV